MIGTDYLSNQFLIAMPGMTDPNFHKTVTFVCEHSDDGALGIIINRPMDLRLSEIFGQLSLESGDQQTSLQPVFRGGPVQQERGFVLHKPGGEWESTLAVSDGIQVTTSRDILHAMAGGKGPEPALVALGYAGWDAGQLEQEMVENSWLSTPADAAIIFETPCEQRLEAAAALMGVDINSLGNYSGHA